MPPTTMFRINGVDPQKAGGPGESGPDAEQLSHDA